MAYESAEEVRIAIDEVVPWWKFVRELLALAREEFSQELIKCGFGCVCGNPSLSLDLRVGGRTRYIEVYQRDPGFVTVEALEHYRSRDPAYEKCVTRMAGVVERLSQSYGGDGQ